MGKNKRVSYQQMLKEAIAEFDTSKNVDVKGPMLDPILSYEGDGELPTYKDAASVLERYYFNEKQDKGVEVSESDYENDKGQKSKDGSEHTEGPGGEEQAGTSDASTIPASKDEKGKDIAKESRRLKEQEEEDEKEEDEKEEKDEEMEESVDLTEEIENAVIEKLIAEMEEEDEEEGEEDKEEEVKESDGNPSSDFKGVADAPKEKEAKGPEEDTQGAGGTQQAGTGNAQKEVPDRKDRHDDAVEPKKYTDESAVREQDEEEEAGAEEGGEEEEEKDLDVDKKVAEASGPGAVPPPSKQKTMGGEGDDELEEAFQLFKEQIEDEDEEEEGGEDEGEEDED